MFYFIHKVHVYLLKYEKKLFIKQKMQEKYGNQALWNKIMPPNLGIKTQKTMHETFWIWIQMIQIYYLSKHLRGFFFYYNSIWLKTKLFFSYKTSNSLFSIEKRRETIISFTSPFKSFYLFPMHFFTIILSI